MLKIQSLVKRNKKTSSSVRFTSEQAGFVLLGVVQIEQKKIQGRVNEGHLHRRHQIRVSSMEDVMNTRAAHPKEPPPSPSK